MKRVLMMAGGTGGHVFPGLAVAKYLREQGVEVHWLGTAQGMEARLVPESQIPMHFISIGGVRGKSLKTLVLAPFRVTLALIQALGIIRQFKPDLVIGMGGFASGPGGIAAWLLRRPLIIHEQNAKAGLTNKWLTKFSSKVLTGFPDVFSKKSQASNIGNPVRAELTKLPPPAERFQGRTGGMRLLVLGGSLGAQAINEFLPRTLSLIAESERPEIYHQTGIKHLEEAENAYQKAGVKAKVVPFISDMKEAYAWADLVLCRAGALTIAELCAVGLGSILVPFPHAVDDHQTANAQFLVENQAAILIQQRDINEPELSALLKDLATKPEKRLQMAEAAYRLRKVDVSEKIYEICKTLETCC